MHFPSILAVALALLAATACSSLSKATIETLDAALYPKKMQDLSHEQLKALPFAVLKLETAQYGTAYLALGRIVDGQRFWAAASGQVLVESHGLIRKTSGFPSTLEGTQFVGQDPFVAGLHHLRGGETFQRRVDWLPGYRFGVLLSSRFSAPLETTLLVQQQHWNVRYIEEELRATPGGFFARNRYWYSSSDGKILRTEQQLTPEERVTVTYIPSEKRS